MLSYSVTRSPLEAAERLKILNLRENNRHDERAVAQAAALYQVRVFILHTFLTRFATTAIVTACLIMVFTPFVKSAWLFMFAGIMGAIASLLLEVTASGKT